MPWSVEVSDVVSEAPGSHHELPDGLAHFEHACRVYDAHAPFEEHTLLTLQGQRQVRHACLVVRDAGLLLGCAVLSEGVDAWSLEVAVLPSHRRRGIGQVLVDAALAHITSHGGGKLRTWVHELSPAVRRLARTASVARTLLVLRRDLDGRLPDPGRPTRPLTDGDRGAWLALSNAAFEGHPENGGWNRGDVDWRADALWTDFRRWPVISDGERLIAGVWTKVEQGSSAGELYVVAVHPDQQGQGLGKVVVAQALHDLAKAGCQSAFLYVDADNAPALGLYRSVGFEDGDIHRCLEVSVLGGSSPRPADRNALLA